MIQGGSRRLGKGQILGNVGIGAYLYRREKTLGGSRACMAEDHH